MNATDTARASDPRPLKDYRLYFFESGTRISEPPFEFRAADDDRAVRIAELQREARKAELWNLERKVRCWGFETCSNPLCQATSGSDRIA